MENDKMPSLAIKILANKPDKNGLCEVKLRVTIDRKTRYYGLGIKVQPNKFDNTSGKIAGKSNDARDLNMQFTARLNFAGDAVESMRNHDEPINFENFERYYLQKPMGAFDRYVHIAMRNVSIIRMKQYAIVVKELKELFGNDISVGDLTYTNILRYEDYMQQKGLRPNSRTQRHKIVKRIIKVAKDADDFFEDEPYKNFVMPYEETHRVGLSEDEYHKLINYQPPTYKLQKIHDLFLFQCNTGLRFCDLNNLTQKDIDDNCIVVRMNKTKRMVAVPLTTTAKQIIERQPKRNDDRFFDKITLQRYNDYLKVIAQGAGISKNVTTHIARYTFANISLENGVPLEVVSELLGHESLKTTKVYAKVSKTMVKREMKKVDDAF